jgi:hypothetical protein
MKNTMRKLNEAHRRAAEDPIVLVLEAAKLGLILLAVFAVLALPAKAERLASCEEIGEAAAEIMGYRQAEIPLLALMEAVEGSPFIEALLLRAYAQPSFADEAHRIHAVQAFREAEVLRCRIMLMEALG